MPLRGCQAHIPTFKKGPSWGHKFETFKGPKFFFPNPQLEKSPLELGLISPKNLIILKSSTKIILTYKGPS